MNRRHPLTIDPAWVGGIAGMLGALLVASLSLGQVPQPDVPAVASDTVQSAQDAAKSTTDTATEATKSARDTATEATKSATDSARDATKSATDTARDAAKSGTKSARDAAKGATRTGRDATKSATDSARDATRSATDTARDATRSSTDTARDATRSSTDTARDATRSSTDAARDAAKSATETTRDATRRATDATRDATRSATETARDAAKSGTDTASDATRSAAETVRDATRSATDSARDVTRSTTEAARDAARSATDTARDAQRSAADAARNVTDTATEAARDVTRGAQETTRDVRDAARSTTQDLRNEARDINRDVHETVDDVRSTTRDASQSVIDQTRQRANADANIRSSSSINLSSMRGADLGIWFDRSVRNGLVIADVAADAALANAGFVEGDRIVSVNGRTITTEQDFLRLVLAENVRQPANVIVMRDGQQETLVIDPTVIRQRYTTVRIDPLERLGVILDDRLTDRLVVWRVIPRSPAFYAGIRAGDEITMFAGQRIADPTKFVQIVERTDAGVVPVHVSRSGRVREFEVDYPQVSEQRTTYRQDLDAATRIETQNNATRSNTNVRGQLNTGVDSNITTPDATVRGRTSASGQLDTQLPSVPDSGDARSSEPSSNRPYYGGSGSGYQRRGLFRRR